MTEHGNLCGKARGGEGALPPPGQERRLTLTLTLPLTLTLTLTLRRGAHGSQPSLGGLITPSAAYQSRDLPEGGLNSHRRLDTFAPCGGDPCEPVAAAPREGEWSGL